MKQFISRSRHGDGLKTFPYLNLLSYSHGPRDALQAVALLYLAAQLLRDDCQCRHCVAHEKREEQHAQHEHWPGSIRMTRQFVQHVAVICLENVAAEEEGQ